MNLENQVCSLELAKKLKELGVKQESLFYWFKTFMSEDDYMLHVIHHYHLEVDRKIFFNHFPDNYSAFTVAELGNMLPDRVDTGKNEPFNNYFISMRIGQLVINPNLNHERNHFINYYCDTQKADDYPFGQAKLVNPMYDSNEANARAKMLIYLLENKLIESI